VLLNQIQVLTQELVLLHALRVFVSSCEHIGEVRGISQGTQPLCQQRNMSMFAANLHIRVVKW